MMSQSVQSHRQQSTACRQECETAAKSLRQLSNHPEADPVQRLRLLCLSRGAHGIVDLGRMFRRRDDDGHKKLSRAAFIRTLKEANFELSDDEMIRLFHTFDDHTGFIDVDDFLHHVRPPMAEIRIRVVEEAFTKMDRHQHGVITMDDLRRVYNVKTHSRYIAGEESEESILNRFMANFVDDASTEEKVTFEEFLHYYSAISASIEDDVHFNLMMRKAYKL